MDVPGPVYGRSVYVLATTPLHVSLVNRVEGWTDGLVTGVVCNLLIRK